MSDIAWFRRPAGDAGTLNVCYHALDRHIIRGHADDIALVGPEWSFARLLTDVAAYAGVLRAFGVTVGDVVSLGALPREPGVVVALAAARVGALASYDDQAAADGRVRIAEVEGDVVLSADGEDLPWEAAMRAGKTDPAPCADVPGDAVLARRGEVELSVLAALGASDDHKPSLPPGATLISVGGVDFWSFDAPGSEG